ncbi:hypothetical protein H8959_014906 [Pygathrix nigripes]
MAISVTNCITIPNPGPGFPVSTRARNSADPSVSVFPHTSTDSPTDTSSFPPTPPPLMVAEPATLQGTVQLGPGVPASPAPTATLPLRCSSSLPSVPPSPSSSRVPGGTDPIQSSALLHRSQTFSFQDSVSSTPGPSHMTRSVTFTITNEAFSAALLNPDSWKHQLLHKIIRHQLQPLYHEAFPSFQGIGVLVFRAPAPCDTAKDVFLSVIQIIILRPHSQLQPGRSPCEVLWALYRKVKTSGQMLGNLSLAENSLTSDGADLITLAQETISIRFTAIRPFLPQLLVPGSVSFVLLERQILQQASSQARPDLQGFPQVTPVVSGFYKASPQERPLLLFSNAEQWVGVYIEYKFQTPIPTHLQGLANHMAQNITDPILQKSSIVANGEKAELVLNEVWLQILGQPYTKALEDKTSPEFCALQGQLTRWVKWWDEVGGSGKRPREDGG